MSLTHYCDNTFTEIYSWTVHYFDKETVVMATNSHSCVWNNVASYVAIG